MKSSLIAYRLRAHRMARNPLPDGAAAVEHLGAVQSQLHDMSLWALSGRTGRTRAELTAAFDAGAFVRTHVLRPTWHHVLVADLPDLLEITAPRVRQFLDAGSASSALAPAERHVAADVAVAFVREHGPVTRAEVATRLVKEGLTGPGGRWTSVPLAFVLMEAEVRGAIGSGPMKGKQHTYRALDLHASSRTADERLAWLATTYVRGHGPARPEDLAWWASLPITVARRAFVLADLRPVTVEGVDLFTTDDADPEPDEVPAAMLLANFDELISYRRDPGDWGPHGTDAVLRAQGLLLVDGALAGLWTRSEAAKAVTVAVTAAEAPTRRVRAALVSEAERYGQFAGIPAKLVIA